jgi:3-oxo-5-alpha-steroid 4-dehydrogenase 1
MLDPVRFYNLTCLLVLFTGIACLILLFFVSAPYGRHNRPGWGLQLDARAAWIIMELPAFAVILIIFLVNRHRTGLVELLFLLFWETHYLYRTFIYPGILRGSTRSFPFLLIFFAWIFNTANGYINGQYLFAFHPAYSIHWLTDIRFIGGLAVFITGLGINSWSDKFLILLRKNHSHSYQIPRGGLFNFISCPNYFGEILEWCGWALMTWSISGALFAFFTFCNLAPRAWANHKWYKKTFPEYPKERKALVPYIW